MNYVLDELEKNSAKTNGNKKRTLSLYDFNTFEPVEPLRLKPARFFHCKERVDRLSESPGMVTPSPLSYEHYFVSPMNSLIYQRNLIRLICPILPASPTITTRRDYYNELNLSAIFGEKLRKEFQLPSKTILLHALASYIEEEYESKISSTITDEKKLPATLAEWKKMKNEKISFKRIYKLVILWLTRCDAYLGYDMYTLPLNSPSTIVILFAVIRKTINSTLFKNKTATSIMSLYLHLSACQYVVYSNVGSETSYSLAPFNLSREDSNLIWNRILPIALECSSLILHLNQSKHAFEKTCNELMQFNRTKPNDYYWQLVWNRVAL
ncbi:hypothetical protein SNEBB_006468 [Seison nebaliae]|nr:hypothetical protein SNEBB_006468 [Seison nebaliae]